MKILLTGANGYIGQRLLPLLIEAGHTVCALVRSAQCLKIPESLQSKVHILEGDLLDPSSLSHIPKDIDAAYYLVHSMRYSSFHFDELEAKCATHFVDHLQHTQAKQIIYLSGLSNETHLSRHLASRKNVETTLKQGPIPVTVLRAGIIIGSGSASFEIIRDLVEKLPIMIAPRWVQQQTQPIAIQNVLQYLLRVLGHPACINQTFEIGGPDIFTYRELLLRFAHLRGLKRWILVVPVLTPALSSYWLCFITSVSYRLSRSLVESLKNKAVCQENRIRDILPCRLIPFDEAIQQAFHKSQSFYLDKMK